MIVSEELPAHWSVRQQAIPIGPHVQLVSRPFPGFPTAEGWNELTGHIEAVHATRSLDLVVVDSLATFLPGRSDSAAGPLLDLLHPLRGLRKWESPF